MLYFGVIILAEVVVVLRALWYLGLIVWNLYVRKAHEANIRRLQGEIAALEGGHPELRERQSPTTVVGLVPQTI